MFFFYSRVSTAGQNSDRQLEAFKQHGGIDPKHVYLDKIQGNIPFFQRPEALRLFEAAGNSPEQHTVVIQSIDRLGRNLIDILRTIEVFTKNGINLRSIKEGFETMVNGQENPMAKIVISVMGSIAELERNKIKERQEEGIKLAKAKGKYKGRKIGTNQTPDKVISKYPLIAQKLKKGLSVRDIAAVTGNSTTTVIKVKKALAA